MTGKQVRTVLPASTWLQARVPLFLPSQRPAKRDGCWQETAWGRCRITGRLGQRHADLLEAICAKALDWRDVDQDGIEVLTDPYLLRRVMAAGSGQYSGEQLLVLLGDLREAAIEIDATGRWIAGNLIQGWAPARRLAANPLTGGERRLWCLRLGSALTGLLRNDHAIWRGPTPIAALKSGVSQALARHVMTHSRSPRGGWIIDSLLITVGVPERTIRKARFRVHDDAAGLCKLGIVIDDDRIVAVANPEAGSHSVESPLNGTRCSAPAKSRATSARLRSYPPGDVPYPPDASSSLQPLSGTNSRPGWAESNDRIQPISALRA